LRNFYGVGTIPTISNRAVVIEYVINERRREFITQGMRWYDIKRFEIPVEHVLVDGSTVQLEDDDLRKVLQIPTSAVDVAGLKPNPR
ncbi:MAG TPA: RagB/SusD family nutrient uptake outer membrane protein, partial [Cyclobacteriaceae bacterium]|nr:RagB/SusD family nutrient uptake outer membrane protein [Cyclobacteriaceae bacterium]